jgi:hypothetical protein
MSFKLTSASPCRPTLAKKMVGVRGFEPPTPASRTQYSTRLSYTPIYGEKRGDNAWKLAARLYG